MSGKKKSNKNDAASYVTQLCRSVIKPTDIVRFDEIISPHELRTFREKMSESDSDSDFADDMDTKEGSY